MRRDVLVGLLQMYGYEGVPQKNISLVELRTLLRQYMKGKEGLPWSEEENLLYKSMVESLEYMGYEDHQDERNEQEVTDIALTCLYDGHQLGWWL